MEDEAAGCTSRSVCMRKKKKTTLYHINVAGLYHSKRELLQYLIFVLSLELSFFAFRSIYVTSRVLLSGFHRKTLKYTIFLFIAL